MDTQGQKEKIKNIVFKHLRGQHPQERHGNRGGRSGIETTDSYQRAYQFYESKVKTGNGDYLIESYRDLKDLRKQEATEPKAYSSWGVGLQKPIETSMARVSKYTDSLRAIRDVAKKHKIDLNGPSRLDKANMESLLVGLNKKRQTMELKKRQYDTVAHLADKKGLRDVINYSKENYEDAKQQYDRQLGYMREYSQRINYKLPDDI